MTTSVADKEMLKFYALSARCYITKPIHWEHLIFVKTLLLASSFFLFPRSKRASQQESLKTPISSLPAFIEMLPIHFSQVAKLVRWIEEWWLVVVTVPK